MPNDFIRQFRSRRPPEPQNYPKNTSSNIISSSYQHPRLLRRHEQSFFHHIALLKPPLHPIPVLPRNNLPPRHPANDLQGPLRTLQYIRIPLLPVSMGRSLLYGKSRGFLSIIFNIHQPYSSLKILSCPGCLRLKLADYSCRH